MPTYQAAPTHHYPIYQAPRSSYEKAVALLGVPCEICGGHMWAYDGECLSPRCLPLDLFKEKYIKSKKAPAKIKEELPAWLAHKPRGQRQLKEAMLYCKEKEIDPPWMTE